MKNIMGELAAYGVAREEARSMVSKETPALGFDSTASEYEITAGKPFDLAEYNVGFAVIAPDTNSFNLIVRHDNPDAIKSLPMDKLRNVLTRILDSV